MNYITVVGVDDIEQKIIFNISMLTSMTPLLQKGNSLLAVEKEWKITYVTLSPATDTIMVYVTEIEDVD